jgi:hypothetical protein
VVEIANRERGAVPHYLPGENPFVNEFADKYHLPREAVLGGAATMYPEYQLTLRSLTANQSQR